MLTALSAYFVCRDKYLKPLVKQRKNGSFGVYQHTRAPVALSADELLLMVISTG